MHETSEKMIDQLLELIAQADGGGVGLSIAAITNWSKQSDDRLAVGAALATVLLNHRAVRPLGATLATARASVDQLGHASADVLEQASTDLTDAAAIMCLPPLRYVARIAQVIAWEKRHKEVK